MAIAPKPFQNYSEMLSAIAAPIEAFRNLRATSVHLLPLLFTVAVLTGLTQFAATVYILRLTTEHHAAMPDAVVRFSALAPFIAAVSSGFVAIVRCFIVAALLWGGLILSDLDISTGRRVAIVAVGQITVALHAIVNLLILILSKAAPTLGHTEVGLNLLLPDSGLLTAWLSLANPFSIWYLVILYTGIRELSGSSPRKSLVTLVPYIVAFLVFFSLQASFFPRLN